MSKEKVLLKFVLDKFSNIKEVLNATKDIEDFLEKLKLNENEEVDIILGKAKGLIDSLYNNSVKIKKEFDEKYKSLKHLTDQENRCENTPEANTSNTESIIVSTEHLENAENDTETTIEHINENEKSTNVEQNEDKEDERENDVNNLDKDPLEDLDNPGLIENGILDDQLNLGKEQESATQNSEELKPEIRSLIRLVDLDKLIDPKQKESVKFDNSIIILTSSDEESPISQKNTETPAKIKKKKNVVDSYDSCKRQVKHSETSKVSKQKKLGSEDNEEHSKHTKTLSENLSDSDIQIQEKKVSNRKDKHAQSSDISESESENMSEQENITESHNKHLRKSPRIELNNTSKEIRKKNLRKIFNKKLHRNDSNKEKSKNESSSDSEYFVKRKLFGRKDLTEKDLTETSSISSSEADRDGGSTKTKSKKNNIKGADSTMNVTLLDKDEKKLNYEVYIPLPKIECRQMKEIYLKNKEIFEIKRLTKLNLPKNQKRFRKTKNDTDKSSSDGEKPKSKKIKETTSTNIPEDSTSDDEPLIKTANNNGISGDVKSLDVTHDLKESTSSKDEHMADIALEKLKEFGEENNTELNKSESEVEKEDSKAEKQDIAANVTEKQVETTEVDDNVKEVSTKNVNESEMDKDAKKDINEAENAEKENDGKEKSDDEQDIVEIIEDDSDNRENMKSKKNWRKDKLLTTRIDSTDSEEELNKIQKKRDESKNDSVSDSEANSPNLKKRKIKKKVRKAVVSSDSEGSKKGNGDSDSNKDADSSDGNDSDSESDEKEEVVSKKPARKRIKRTKDSSSSEDDKSTRKHIRKLIGRDSLSETTKQAEAEEKERKARIAEKQKKYNKLFEATAESKVDKLVLDYDEAKEKELLALDKKICKKLKPHQASGIQFMWDACFESIKRANSTKGSGCILAHCMGLGKTLQVIALSHTLLTNAKHTGVHKVMVVCPLNTVLNWKSEFTKWIPKNEEFEVYELVSCKQNYERQYIVNEWHTDGGVLIIGYNMFRNLSNPDNKRLSKKMRNSFNEGLVDPGPDLVVCDEGHLLKNEKTNLSIAMNRIKTARRIVLTGTPLQNNLKEYWCMVQFIKPNLLGTYKEYLNRFVNPIINGQYTDSTQHDILLMRKRSHVLHKLLDGVVQRRDYAVLEPYLPPKQEYVLFIRLSETQVKIYKHYMAKFARQSDGSNRTSFLFSDFQELQRICTHPRVLLDKSNERREKEFEDEDSEGSLKDFIDDGNASTEQSGSTSSSKSDSEDSDNDKGNKVKGKGKQQRVRVTRAQAAQRRENNEESDPEVEEVKKEWFQEYCDGDELDNINNSGKLFLLFQILKECEEIGDKILVFSQSLYTLNCIEYFLEKIDEATQKGEAEKVGGHSGSWSIGLDYFRLDGSSSCDNRAVWCNMFNNPNNTRARLFLISTKAGGLGINLVAANRVIIFDVSWNPSHDIQSIYRVYRFGQTKPCYIYRFVTYGTMEMKIYERQVTKQAISKRVIDEQQIDRHYNQNDLQELYQCDLEPTDRPIPMVPKDVLLGEMLQKYENTIFKYHLHQSLLENKEDEGLNEEERKAAWEEFENEKVLRRNTGMGLNPNSKVNAQAIETALASVVRKDNPTWTEIQIRGIIPALVQQLQVQLQEGDMTMYTRVQQEIQLLQEMQAQKLREAYYQHQVLGMIQRQQQQAKMMGNLYVDPTQLARAQQSTFNNANMNRGGPSTAQRFSNEIIELND